MFTYCRETSRHHWMTSQDTVGNEKASIEKQNRTLQAQLSDVQRKCDEANLILGDYDNAKKKVVIENADLLRQV